MRPLYLSNDVEPVEGESEPGEGEGWDLALLGWEVGCDIMLQRKVRKAVWFKIFAESTYFCDAR
jgi:hypothetical protein